MTTGEAEHSPSLEVAFATLKTFADAFLSGGARLPADAPDGDAVVATSQAMLLLDGDGIVRGVGDEAERMLGRPSRELLGIAASAVLGALPAAGAASRVHVQKEGHEVALWLTRADMTTTDGSWTILSLHDQDVAADKRTDLRYRHLVEQIPAVVFTGALDGGLYDVYVSPQIEQLLGYSQDEWIGDPTLWYERLHPDDRRKLDEEFARGCLTGGPFRADCRFLTRDGRTVWVHGEARLIKDARGVPLLLQGVAFDITETKRGEEIARASLREKETLLKEIHHRVKNNLQVTSSLIRLQADRIEDAAAKTALRDSQNRIRSMALVHELLYRSKDLSQVDLAEYVRDLTRPLPRSHASPSSNVKVSVELAPTALPIDVAVPCGLILNELVSNALEHAFPDGKSGTVTVALDRRDDVDELVVRDDGVGLPADLQARSNATLGLRLIGTLAAQIDAELVTSSDERGTRVALRIPRHRRELP